MTTTTTFNGLRVPATTHPTFKGKAGKEELDEDRAEDEDNENEAPSTMDISQLLLANKWDIESGLDPTDWCISRVYGMSLVHSSIFGSFALDSDAYSFRTYIHGKKKLSRLMNPSTPPQRFLDSPCPHLICSPRSVFTLSSR